MTLNSRWIYRKRFIGFEIIGFAKLRNVRFGKLIRIKEWFAERIDTAIQNEKKYCEDEAELEPAVGSRIGVLIRELRVTE